MLSTSDIVAKYGMPGAVPMARIATAYPMKLAWSTDVEVNMIACHPLIATRLQQTFKDLLAYYGIKNIKKYGLDLFGGCYNNRPMRGAEVKYQRLMKQGKIEEAMALLSRHAWGIAIDLDPERNSLKAKADTASFAKKEFEGLHKIFERNGFINYGKVKGYDFMHFEINI